MSPSTVRRTIKARLSVAVACLLIVAASSPGAVAAAPPKASGDGSWIVSLQAGSDVAAAKRTARDAGGSIGLTFRHALHGFVFKGSAAAADALRSNPRVLAVVPDRPLTLTETLPFGIKRIDAHVPGSSDGAYQAGYRGAGTRIAIIDTGIDLDHPDLAAHVDVAGGLNCATVGPPNDGHGHGSHVAGTAAAPLNEVGVVGVAPEATLVPIKVFDDAGNSSESLVLCGIDYATGLNTDADPDNDIDVASMSFGESRAWGDCVTDPLHTSICAAAATGMVLVGGSGNSAVNAGTFVPAAFPEVISVSALADFDGQPGGLASCGFVPDIFWFECDDTFAMFSNFGPVDVIAPGVSIHSTWKDGGYSTISGTSMATPHVSGVAALMKSVNPALTGADVLALLQQSGECPNGAWADADATSGCAGQGTWTDDPDGTPEPLVSALRATLAAGGEPPPPPVAPGAPTLNATAGDDLVDLTWTVPASGGSPITGYVVYRGDTPGTATQLTTVGATTTYRDSTAASGSTYWYQVAAVNAVDTGARSNEVSASPVEPSPVPPSAPALSASLGGTVVTLSWTVPNDGNSPITGYVVYRGTTSGGATQLTTVGTVTAFADAGVTPGITYYYQVAAVNSIGTGARSNQVAAALPWSQAPQGDWVGNFGQDGYVLMAWNATSDVVSMPRATLTLDQGSRYRWNAGTTNVRAVEDSTQALRRAAQWYHSSSLRMHLTFANAYSGTLHLYALDWDGSSRRQNVVVTDASGSRTAILNKSFNGGAWLHFPIDVAAGGTVSIRADKTAGGNSTLSGLFLGGAGGGGTPSPTPSPSPTPTPSPTPSPTPTPTPSSTPTPTPQPSSSVTPTPAPTPAPPWEVAPQGDWVGRYGGAGYALLAWNSTTDLVSLPNASLTLDQGGRYRWSSSTTSVRALENESQTARRAAQWFHSSSLRLHLTFSSAYSGVLHLYAIDWDGTSRRQTVIVNDGSGARTVVLATSFNSGAWMHFPVNVNTGGVVAIRIDRNAGQATLSGIFLGGP